MFGQNVNKGMYANVLGERATETLYHRISALRSFLRGIEGNPITILSSTVAESYTMGVREH
jgi:hypothetical protein